MYVVENVLLLLTAFGGASLLELQHSCAVDIIEEATASGSPCFYLKQYRFFVFFSLFSFLFEILYDQSRLMDSWN